MKDKGITLLELVVVLAIMGILLAITIPPYTKWKKKYDKENDVKALYALFQNARMKAFTEKRTCGVTWNGRIFSLRCDTDYDYDILDSPGSSLVSQITTRSNIEVASQIPNPLLVHKDGLFDLPAYSSGCSCSSASCGFATDSDGVVLEFCNYFRPEGSNKCLGFYGIQIREGEWKNGCTP